ncbi:MAG: hypothetical protein M9963_05970 [Kiritimatiellae bacterium]|nr:hypothetical protein [Kiritimatiellia bacterium]
MTRLERRIFVVINLLVAGSGAAFGLIDWLGKPSDGVSLSHPWVQPALFLHVLFAPMLVFAIGHLFYHHGVAMLSAGMAEGRRSGAALLALALPMIFSGYLFQLVMNEGWRTVWLTVHISSAILWIASVSVHIVVHVRARRCRSGQARR